MADSESRLGDPPAGVLAHLSILQAVIQRMAENSSTSKAWCIALVSAMLVLVADKGTPDLARLALIPTALFFALDVYYLALEKAFRATYEEFVGKVHSGELRATDLYLVAPAKPMIRYLARAVLSFSVWPFYGTLSAMIVVTRRFVL